jgi:hypothetical protein
MAIGTYAELQTAVANWLDRDDLGDRIPEFIALAEARMNRLLRLRMMESKYTASTVAAQRNYALPTGYVQMRNFQINLTPIRPIQYVTPEVYDRIWGGSSSGTPEVYTIIANELQLGPRPDSIMTMEMLFYKKVTALSGSNTTEQMLTESPDIYLYGALLEAEPFIMNDERVGLWAQGFAQAVQALQEQDNKDRHSGSALRVMNTGGYY